MYGYSTQFHSKSWNKQVVLGRAVLQWSETVVAIKELKDFAEKSLDLVIIGASPMRLRYQIRAR